MEIRLASPVLQSDSIVDGEGIRAVLWTQGCLHKCPGCHNPQTHSFDDGFLVDIREIEDQIDELEGQMLAEIAATHCDAPADACPDSADGMAEDARLFAAFPYDGVYSAYLHMKADLYFGDTEKYENSAMQFASAYSAFADYYNRTHLPLTGAKIRL